jgi:steroid delta-isomerase-like uncharacterized protein
MRERMVTLVAVLVAAMGCAPEPTLPPPVAATPAPAPPAAPLPPPQVVAPEPPPPPKPTMADAQRKYLADLEAALAARDAKRFASLYGTGAILVSAGREGVHQATGRDEIEKGREHAFRVVGKAFPDIRWTHTRVLTKGDAMVVEWVAAATDTGGFMDDKPTGKKLGWRGVSILRFDDDGLVMHETTVLDPLTIMGQLGRGDPRTRVRPPPPPLASTTTTWLAANESPEEQKNLEAAKGVYAAFEKKDDKAFLALLSDDVVRSDQTQPEDVKGKEGARRDLQSMTKVFPDLTLTVKNAWAFGALVVTEVELTGTFKGPMGAIKPNGKRGTTHGIDVFEMKDGKVARLTSYANGRELAMQYDLLPPPTTAAQKP